MKKIAVILLVLISVVSFASYKIHYTAMDYTRDLLVMKLGVNVGEKMFQSIKEELELLNNPQLDPFLILAIMQTESSFRNIEGDHGKAIGFFQLHKVTIEYVIQFYPDLKEKYAIITAGWNHDFKDIKKYPIFQSKVAIRYLHLILQYWANGDLNKALSFYNGRGGTQPYNEYVVKILNYKVLFMEDYLSTIKGM